MLGTSNLFARFPPPRVDYTAPRCWRAVHSPQQHSAKFPARSTERSVALLRSPANAPAEIREHNDVAQIRRDAEPCPPHCRDAVGRHSIAGAASGQALVHEFLCRGAGGLPYRASCCLLYTSDAADEEDSVDL